MMLKPRAGGVWLEVEEVVRRLRSEFARIELTTQGVKEYADGLSQSYRKQGQGAAADRVDAARDQGACVLVMDGPPDHAFVLMLLPGIPIMAGFVSTENLEAMQPNLRRCAAVLGYDLK